MREFKVSEENTPFEIVYFLKCGPYVKIGKCFSHKWKRRLSTLQTANPKKLDPIGYCLGGYALETDYHRAFKQHHVSGEWYHLAPLLPSIMATARDFSTLK
jgi:hypothetical protein